MGAAIGNEPGFASRPVKRLWLATRPMFFPASVLPVIVGTGWGAGAAGGLDGAAFALALAATICVHAAVNVINDVYDDISGTDPVNTGRIHPFTGGSRFIQNGIMDRRAMARFGLALLAAATLVGIVLAVLKGPVVIALGLFGAALGIAYSATPFQLSARGLGEIAVGLGFGVLPVMGASWLQSGSFGPDALLLSLPLGCWVFNILLVNEIPDIEADAAAGKRTLPVRRGVDGSWPLYLAANALAWIAVAAAAAIGLLPVAVLALPTLLVVGAVYVARMLARGTPTRSTLATAIKATLACHGVGGVWLAVFVWTS